MSLNVDLSQMALSIQQTDELLDTLILIEELLCPYSLTFVQKAPAKPPGVWLTASLLSAQHYLQIITPDLFPGTLTRAAELLSAANTLAVSFGIVPLPFVTVGAAKAVVTPNRDRYDAAGRDAAPIDPGLDLSFSQEQQHADSAQ